jgi:RNA-directed DNA polymerase
VNTDEPWPDSDAAWWRVLKIQTKLHQWATDDPNRRFDDLYNLVTDPSFLVVAWERVRGNRGARTAGVDGVKPSSIIFGAETLLCGLRAELKDRTFRPMPVRERTIPKANGKLRRLGIATARDRVVQASLKLVLEPIFEADFQPCSYGFRPKRRAYDAIAEIHHFTSRSYEWILEGDITACFDEISHVGLMDRVRARIGDKRVLDLVKAFLKAGILYEDGIERDTLTGCPQGSLCAAAHNAPYEQCRVMHSVGPSSLVKAGSGTERCT